MRGWKPFLKKRSKRIFSSSKEYHMKTESRIWFNPVTKEIEIEGSESFVKTYFDKLHGMISGDPEETVKESKAVKVSPAKKAPGVKRVTNIDMIIGLIQGSAEGISTAELKEKTGLAESQIWNIVNRASKLGKIKKVKRGIYGAA
jgi:hypothetical protein